MAAKRVSKRKPRKLVTLAQLYRRSRRDPVFFEQLLANPTATLRDAGLQLSPAEARSFARWRRARPFAVKLSNRAGAQQLAEHMSRKIGPVSWPVIPWLERGPLNPWKPRTTRQR